MKYNLTFDSHTWSFADANNLTFEWPKPLTTKSLVAATPQWHKRIPEELGLNERGDDQTCESFKKFLKTDIGAITWHLFKYTAYHFPINENIDYLTKAAVVTSLNTSGNKIMYIEGLDIAELIDFLFTVSESYGFTKPKSAVLGRPLATMLVRLFNYYECQQKRLKKLFYMTPRNIPVATCPACQTVFGHTGEIIEPPCVDVDSETWTSDLALEGGFGWFPGSDEGTGFERQDRRRD